MVEHIETELEGSSRRTSDWDARSEVGTGPWLWLGMFLVAGMLGRGRSTDPEGSLELLSGFEGQGRPRRSYCSNPTPQVT